MQMWQIVANLEFVTGFAIDLQTRKPNISPRELRTLRINIFSKKHQKQQERVVKRFRKELHLTQTDFHVLASSGS